MGKFNQAGLRLMIKTGGPIARMATDFLLSPAELRSATLLEMQVAHLRYRQVVSQCALAYGPGWFKVIEEVEGRLIHRDLFGDDRPIHL